MSQQRSTREQSETHSSRVDIQNSNISKREAPSTWARISPATQEVASGSGGTLVPQDTISSFHLFHRSSAKVQVRIFAISNLLLLYDSFSFSSSSTSSENSLWIMRGFVMGFQEGECGLWEAEVAESDGEWFRFEMNNESRIGESSKWIWDVNL